MAEKKILDDKKRKFEEKARMFYETEKKIKKEKSIRVIEAPKHLPSSSSTSVNCSVSSSSIKKGKATTTTTKSKPKSNDQKRKFFSYLMFI